MTNLDLWNRVRTPDPKHTKSFNRPGGFKGTSISPIHLIEMATAEWGIMGDMWGAEELETRIESGVWFSKVRVWFPEMTGKGVEQWGGTQFQVIRKDGVVFYDDEAPKKSYTDALSKCLSWLGFGADVHMGLFDDVKYVNDAQAKFDSQKATKTAKANKEEYARIKDLILSAASDAELDQIREECKAQINKFKSQDMTFYDDIVATAAHQRQVIKDISENNLDARFNQLTEE